MNLAVAVPVAVPVIVVVSMIVTVSVAVSVAVSMAVPVPVTIIMPMSARKKDSLYRTSSASITYMHTCLLRATLVTVAVDASTVVLDRGRGF